MSNVVRVAGRKQPARRQLGPTGPGTFDQSYNRPIEDACEDRRAELGFSSTLVADTLDHRSPCTPRRLLLLSTTSPYPPRARLRTG